MKLLGSLIFTAWVLVTLGAFAIVCRYIIAARASALVKAVLALGVLGLWALLQFTAFIFAFRMIYCENCADKPLQTEDVVATLILLAPSAVLVGVSILLSLRSKGGKQTNQHA